MKLKKYIDKMVLLIFICCSINIKVNGTMINHESEEYEALAERWAPVFFHDVGMNYGLKGMEDVPMRIDFDGDWNGSNNWSNLERVIDDEIKGDLNAYVYYSIQETKSYFYITYCVFHPRDTASYPGGYDKHENDIESVFMSIKKNNRSGELEAVITQSHGWWNLYKSNQIRFLEGKPCLWIDSGGHAIYRYQGEDARGLKKDGVIYSVDKSAVDKNSFYEEVYSDNKVYSVGNFNKVFNYKLIKLNDLYLRSLDRITNLPDLYHDFGVMKGQVYGKNKAILPWGKRKVDKYYSYLLWEDPEKGFNYLFRRNQVEEEYVYNENYNFFLTLIKNRKYNGNLIVEIKMSNDDVFYRDIFERDKNELRAFLTVPTNKKNKVKMEITIKQKKGLKEEIVEKLSIDNLEQKKMLKIGEK